MTNQTDHPVKTVGWFQINRMKIYFFWESLYHDILHGLWLELAMNLFTKRLRNTDDVSLDCEQKNCEVG